MSSLRFAFKPARSRKRPTGFIPTAQPILSTTAPNGAKWIHEIKFDGFRMMAVKTGGKVRLWSRHGTDFTARMTRIVAAVEAMPDDDLVFDGEAISARPDGHCDFEALRSKEGAAGAILMCFDVLSVGAIDLRKEPFGARRKRLERLLAKERDGLPSDSDL